MGWIGSFRCQLTNISYELQLADAARNSGKGAQLMQVLETFGHNVGLKKAMLTVFSENEGAIRFYKKNG